ncbi:hypothetical protein [Bdellovibrio bacteriovorus]|uniref:Uncharacterized protein n=1 Tax=Bdellovibrio bacteriovorus TaxID=959 RepID=A0A1Z3N970_BDEBC|nr:hypothetical protein [Bdellovibrio bacteriovorus]ASD63971.1 hypothetical protein B9G79_10520 [Bdellovibrio bacteriovorus]
MLAIFAKLGKMNKIPYEFNVYGPPNGFHFEVDGDISKYHGPLSREGAISAVKLADILVNVENTNCVMTPSKVVEYVATGKPIINIMADLGSTPLLRSLSADRCLNIRHDASVDEAARLIEVFLEEYSRQNKGASKEYIRERDLVFQSGYLLDQIRASQL